MKKRPLMYLSQFLVTRRTVLCCEAAEMNFIEDDARWVIDSP